MQHAAHVLRYRRQVLWQERVLRRERMLRRERGMWRGQTLRRRQVSSRDRTGCEDAAHNEQGSKASVLNLARGKGNTDGCQGMTHLNVVHSCTPCLALVSLVTSPSLAERKVEYR